VHRTLFSSRIILDAPLGARNHSWSPGSFIQIINLFLPDKNGIYTDTAVGDRHPHCCLPDGNASVTVSRTGDDLHLTAAVVTVPTTLFQVVALNPLT